ncbi:amidohydrolase [Fodinisporobacter ferrooxydans]|uniref:5-methylthioadenosine/S-adenosylhomocysteine deaminase n=1 Tax=Fodinisporobacter ferrooxydans TaxID=2901836 RepID=A0ABY4CJQ6_9BACL|nr:amidohydrolase [Alicyclobacillaceae bacterium MYW30-H2]
MKLLIEHAAIVASATAAIIENGYIVTNGSYIEKIGSGEWQDAKDRFDQVIDAGGCVVMPGLINTHGHAAMALLRGYADDLPLQEWLQNKIWPLEDQLTAEDIYVGTQLGILEMLKSGTTCFTDMYFFEEQVALAVEQSGMRAVLSRGLIGFGEKGESAKQEAVEFVGKYEGYANGRIRTMLGPHAPYTCPPEYLRGIAELSKELQVPIQIHLSETRKEVADCLQQYGKTPIQLVKEVGLLDRPVIGAHCVHVTDEDLDIIAACGMAIAHNPNSNLKLGSGIAPLTKMLERGIVVGLGTDGAASNNRLDMFEEMRMAAMIHKGLLENPLAISASTALHLATKGGADALFLGNSLGTLTVGSLADFIIVDFQKPHLQPRHDILAHLVYAAAAGDVRDVIIDGRVVIQNKACLTLDETQIFKQANQIVDRLLQRQ